MGGKGFQKIVQKKSLTQNAVRQDVILMHKHYSTDSNKNQGILKEE